jgi:hypothetical protein
MESERGGGVLPEGRGGGKINLAMKSRDVTVLVFL